MHKTHPKSLSGQLQKSPINAHLRPFMPETNLFLSIGRGRNRGWTPKLAHILVKTSIRSKNILGEEVREKLANEQDIYDKLTEMAVDKVKLKDVSESKRYGSPPPEVYPKLKT